MLLSEFDYELPEDLIAQKPTEKRQDSKMMVLDRKNHQILHKHFYDIVDLIDENAVLILNNTKVMPARLYGYKETGAKIEVFLLKEVSDPSPQPSPARGEGASLYPSPQPSPARGEGASLYPSPQPSPARGEGASLYPSPQPSPARGEGASLHPSPLSGDFATSSAERVNKEWEVLIRPSKRVREGTIVKISDELSAEILKPLPDDGKWLVRMIYEGDIFEILHKVGNIPLPPYIERKMASDELKKLDFERYQTVYAKDEGSVAAPTAGLHFTTEILNKLKAKGVEIGYVTLNVGMGTFRPVKCENILEHKMDSESFEITQETADLINRAKSEGKKIIAVGTTTVRTLETAFQQFGEIKACKSASELFIYPPYEFKVIDKLITNFHLPKSTLLMLVSALAGKDFIFEAYKSAIENRYRFYSYGDCMFID